ncbi:MAG: hypothetical protein OEZ06_06350 [Myxococcales bacterium]|nr:hypothetical protein [Myxococcales bacterium]
MIALLAFAACSSEGDAGLLCIEGMTVSCACLGGDPGVQTCTSEGTYSECSCVAGGLTGGGDPGAGPGATDGTGTQGAAGIGAGGTAGAGAGALPASDGTTPAEGTPQDGGALPADGGAPVSAGTVFAPCASDGDCADGLLCTMPSDGQGWCAESCGTATPFGVFQTGECTQPTTGIVRAECNGLGLCGLSGCAENECPTGMTCATRPGGAFTGGNSECVYP